MTHFKQFLGYYFYIYNCIYRKSFYYIPPRNCFVRYVQKYYCLNHDKGDFSWLPNINTIKFPKFLCVASVKTVIFYFITRLPFSEG
jgi:hypothetical protein